MRASWQERYTQRFYQALPGWVDGTTEFHALCASVIPRGARILEIGAGPSNATSRFLATVGDLHGADPDDAIEANDALSSATVMKGETLPFGAGSFDACVSNYVVEHVANPTTHLREVARVLRHGGVYVFRTPNLFHYVTLASRLTPHWFHALVANRLKNARDGSHEPYPTHYRLNSRAAVRRAAQQNGFDTHALRLIEKEPSYGQSSRALFFAFLAYERVVNSTPVIADLRSNILAVLKKR